MARNLLTPELARKSSRIIIGTKFILVYFKKTSKMYGVSTDVATFTKTKGNLEVANRYK